MADTLKAVEHKLELAKKRDARQRDLVDELKGAFVRKTASMFSAAALGVVKRYKVPDDVGGFPWKLGVWGLATLGEIFTDGYVQKTAGAVGDMTLGIYTHDAIATGKIIAGGDVDGSDLD